MATGVSLELIERAFRVAADIVGVVRRPSWEGAIFTRECKAFCPCGEPVIDGKLRLPDGTFVLGTSAFVKMYSIRFPGCLATQGPTELVLEG